MRKRTGNGKAHHLAAYSAMAALILTGKNSEAEVLYTDIADTTIDIGATFDLDIDGDGTFDFHFVAGSVSSATGTNPWSFASVFGYVQALSIGNASNMIMGYAGTFYGYASHLAAGDPVGTSGPWLSYPSYNNSAVMASNYYGEVLGQFPAAGEGYLGIRFLKDDAVHYGWVRLSADIAPAQITILDYAYEMYADLEILAGSTTSSAIAELPEGSVSVYSFDQTVAVINNAGIANGLIRVFSITGQNVFETGMLSQTTTIDMQSFSGGNYIILVITGKGTFTKKTFIN